MPKFKIRQIDSVQFDNGIGFPVAFSHPGDDNTKVMRHKGAIAIGSLTQDPYPSNPLDDGYLGEIVYREHGTKKFESAFDLRYGEPDYEGFRADARESLLEASLGGPEFDPEFEPSEEALEKEEERLWAAARKAGEVGDRWAVVLSHNGSTGEWTVAADSKTPLYSQYEGDGVWLPCDYIRKEIEALPEAERDARAILFAESACEVYSQYCTGDVWDICVEVFSPVGEDVDVESRSIGGHYGHSHAEDSLDCLMVEQLSDVEFPSPGEWVGHIRAVCKWLGRVSEDEFDKEVLDHIQEHEPFGATDFDPTAEHIAARTAAALKEAEFESVEAYREAIALLPVDDTTKGYVTELFERALQGEQMLAHIAFQQSQKEEQQPSASAPLVFQVTQGHIEHSPMSLQQEDLGKWCFVVQGGYQCFDAQEQAEDAAREVFKK